MPPRVLRPVAAALVAGGVTIAPVPALAPTALAAPAPTAPHAAPTAPHAASVHVVKVDGAVNVRDVGGYAGAGGRHVRYGLVYRSASLSKVTPAGVQALAGLRLSAAVDFRSDGEVRSDGADRLPAGVAAVPAHINPFSTSLLELGPDVIKAFLAKNKAEGFMALSYRGFVHDPASRAQFAATLKRIAAGNGPVLYHCTAGKDRTGTMTAILLTALGVGKRQVYADYLRSNRELAAQNDATLAKLKQVGIDPELVRPFLGVEAGYLDAAFDQIKRDFGTFDAFLAKGLGIDAATRAKLRARMLH
ncbi:tyrosine-protein phosphatase [Actinomadura rupiterrae]|uniref:tyrosine-protein phosphatase n=1 Tax=Actinomadura rupiterrae TaxID=559627 RepID=UPI0020A3655D|nr:tyrosine-protein phosphatase [Actinomadura rupiterrae]MCP2338020.1 protein-tyrosine phosphatase [Actinomadura rupiterrae]